MKQNDLLKIDHICCHVCDFLSVLGAASLSLVVASVCDYRPKTKPKIVQGVIQPWSQPSLESREASQLQDLKETGRSETLSACVLGMKQDK